MSHVWEDSGIESRAELLVLLALADHAKDDGVCWPSIDSIAKKSRVSQRGVQEIIKKLEGAGRLKVKTGEGPNGTNVYKVIVGGCSGCTPQPAVGKNDGYLHPNHKEPSVTTSTNPNTNTSGAEEVYRAYPRKVGKPAAIKAIERAIKTHGLELVMAGTKAFTAASADTEPHFIPYPQKFYNQERYLNEWKKPQIRLSAWEIKQRIEAIQERLRSHPCNRQSVYASNNPTPEQRKEYIHLTTTLDDLKLKLAS